MFTSQDAVLRSVLRSATPNEGSPYSGAKTLEAAASVLKGEDLTQAGPYRVFKHSSDDTLTVWIAHPGRTTKYMALVTNTEPRKAVFFAAPVDLFEYHRNAKHFVESILGRTSSRGGGYIRVSEYGELTVGWESQDFGAGPHQEALAAFSAAVKNSATAANDEKLLEKASFPLRKAAANLGRQISDRLSENGSAYGAGLFWMAVLGGSAVGITSCVRSENADREAALAFSRSEPLKALISGAPTTDRRHAYLAHREAIRALSHEQLEVAVNKSFTIGADGKGYYRDKFDLLQYDRVTTESLVDHVAKQNPGKNISGVFPIELRTIRTKVGKYNYQDSAGKPLVIMFTFEPKIAGDKPVQ